MQDGGSIPPTSTNTKHDKMTYEEVLNKDYTLGRGYVYLLRYNDVLGRPVVNDKKIGYATDYVTRFSNFEGAQASLRYEFISVYEVDKPYGVEQLLHNLVGDRQIKFNYNGAPHKTEWFLDEDDVIKSEFETFIESLTELSPDKVSVLDTVPQKERLNKLRELGITTLRKTWHFGNFRTEVNLNEEGLAFKDITTLKQVPIQNCTAVLVYLTKFYGQDLQSIRFTTLSTFMNGICFFFRPKLMNAIVNGEEFNHPGSGANGLDRWEALVDGKWIKLDNEFSNFV